MKQIGKARPDITVDLGGGASIVFKTQGRTTGVVAARRAAGLVIAEGGDEADATVAFTVRLAQWGALSWTGVAEIETNDQGESTAVRDLPLTRENLADLMADDPDVYRRIDQQFVFHILELEAEKNESAPSPAGDMPAGALTENSPTPGAAVISAPPATASATSAPTS